MLWHSRGLLSPWLSLELLGSLAPWLLGGDSFCFSCFVLGLRESFINGDGSGVPTVLLDYRKEVSVGGGLDRAV